jgi:hypothetical protein
MLLQLTILSNVHPPAVRVCLYVWAPAVLIAVFPTTVSTRKTRKSRYNIKTLIPLALAAVALASSQLMAWSLTHSFWPLSLRVRPTLCSPRSPLISTCIPVVAPWSTCRGEKRCCGHRSATLLVLTVAQLPLTAVALRSPHPRPRATVAPLGIFPTCYACAWQRWLAGGAARPSRAHSDLRWTSPVCAQGLEPAVNLVLSTCVAREWARDFRKVLIPIGIMTVGMMFAVDASALSNVRDAHCDRCPAHTTVCGGEGRMTVCLLGCLAGSCFACLMCPSADCYHPVRGQYGAVCCGTGGVPEAHSGQEPWLGHRGALPRPGCMLVPVCHRVPLLSMFSRSNTFRQMHLYTSASIGLISLVLASVEAGVADSSFSVW